MSTEEQGKQVVPSEFMRQLRPELYSDTKARSAYVLDAALLELRLENITARNETHGFELFCRKLCERTICLNLKPATGPEGGGDSKADTETIPIADEISTLYYVGEANAAKERWAFCFSAKKRWAEKARADVAGVVATQRGYQKIYFVTSRFARAKDRARIEDALSKQHGVKVTILDRTWIVEQIIEHDRKDLAFNYLGVGQEVADPRRLGPSDYSRSQQLEDIEQSLGDPERFKGMEMQRATEALVAAKLSRSLERPRIETDGRLARAVRLAEQDGTYRQKIEAHYERIWTAFWWFDDVAQLNESYDAFGQLVINSDQAKNLELLCNLTQLLFNSVLHKHLTPEQAKLDERVTRLTDRLRILSVDHQRPNNALEALTSLLAVQVNLALLRKDSDALSSLWREFSDVVKQAKGLGEFSAERLTKLVEVFGLVARNDSNYALLVDDVAAFVSERTGEAQGALVLLKRAEQLDFDQNFEMIRILGKAARQLTKKEFANSLIEATRLLAIAYRSAGLLWAARASCIFAIASIFIEAEDDNDLPASVVPTFMLLALITVELGHLPDTLEAIRLVRGCAIGLPLDDASTKLVVDRLMDFDLILASKVLNFTAEELQRTSELPDVFARLELDQSRSALLYALGYESLLREEGWIPESETQEGAADLFTLLASQPTGDRTGPIIFNESEHEVFVAKVQGIRVEVDHLRSEISILTAEAVIGAIEVLCATVMDLGAAAHTEHFRITIKESKEFLEPTFEIDHDEMAAIVCWPAALVPGDYSRQDQIQRMLFGLAAEFLVTTCFAKDFRETIERLFSSEAVTDRLAMLVAAGNSRHRTFKNAVSRLGDWNQHATKAFPPKESRPSITRRKLDVDAKEGDPPIAASRGDAPPRSNDHRDLGVRSVIDIHLWDRAGWTGMAFLGLGPNLPPAIALVFTDEDAARKIFTRWRERFGQVDKKDEIYLSIIRNVSPENPAHYRVLITSELPSEENHQKLMMAVSRMLTMEPQSDINLSRFLDSYGRAGAYLLLPAVMRGTAPESFPNLSILKRKLTVKLASEVGKHDMESVAVFRP